jgi:hypothetical protein
MSVPTTGLILIPLGLVIALLPWRFALAGLVAFSMMSPAAVVNAGNFGLQPGYYLALLLIARTLGQVMAQNFTLNGFVLGRLKPLFWFMALVFAILFVALCFFQDVETLPGSSGFKSGMTRPFHLARENFTQITYLTLNIVLVYAMAHNGARQTPEKLVRTWDAAMICGLAFAVAVCAWQFASLYGGVTFPSDFFYSNAGYSRADSQSMAGLFRINGPFEEPSTLGYTFTGYLLYAWGRYGVRQTGTAMAMIAASAGCMLVSTSTTAFLGLALFAALAGWDIATGKVKLLPEAARRTAGFRLMAILLILAAAGGAIILAANWPAIELILQNTVFNKSSSTSFQQRSFADHLALQIFGQTYGVGVGLGSHKANSLLLTLLSNTGILGLVLFGSFAFGLLKSVRSGASARVVSPLRPFKLGLLGLLAVHLISNPNLSTLTLWLSMGGLLALQAAERRQSVIQEVLKSSAAMPLRLADRPAHASL